MFECILPTTLFQYLTDPESVSTLCQRIMQTPSNSVPIDLVLYAKLFLLTCALEAPVYFVICRWKIPTLNFKNFLGWLLILNIATHPAVAFLWPKISHGFGNLYVWQLLWSEVFAFSFEAILICLLARRWSVWLIFGAVIANLCSWYFGIQLIRLGQ